MRPSTVLDTLECGNFQQVAVLCIDGAYHFIDECRVVVGLCSVCSEISPCRVYGQFLVFTAAVYGSIVLVHHVFTLLAVGLHDELLHLFYRQVYRDDTGDTEECRLEDGIGTVAQSDFLCNLGGVDVIYLDIVLGKVSFHLVRQVLGQFFAFPDGVEQERAVLLQSAGHIVHVEVSLNVASHEVRRVHQVSGADGSVSETQVRARETAGLLRVVREVSLTVLVGVVADNLHGVLVGTHRTVGTQAVELGFEHAFATHGHLFFLRKRSERHVVHDAEGELVFRFRKSQILVHGQDLCRSCVVRPEAVTSAYDDRSVFLAVEAFLHIQIQRFAVGARFFRAVQYGNRLGCGRNGCQEMLGRERTIQVNGYQAHLFALCGQVVDGFADGFGYGTHGDDDAFCVCGTVVREQAVFAAGDFRHLVHVVLYDGRNCVVVIIARFTVSEERVGVFGHTACHRMFGRQGAAAELLQSLLVYQRSEVVVLQHFNLLDFVRRTETVEEVQERHAALDGRQVCHAGQIHHFLYGTFAQHGETGLAARHDVLMVTEDTQ